jgi:hypothetical protein
LPEGDTHEGAVTPIEIDIMRSFGWTAIIYEDSLYERFLHLSSEASLTPFDVFRKHLLEMETKGYVSSFSLHGNRAYKRLFVEEQIGAPLYPRVPLDEIRLALGSRKARQKRAAPRQLHITTEVIHESELVGRSILFELKRYLAMEHGVDAVRRSVLVEHIDKICQALCQDENTCYEYLRRKAPGVITSVRGVIDTKGPNFLLLGLKLIESDMRRSAWTTTP